MHEIVSVFLDRASRNEDIVLYGNGGRVQNYLDVRDLADAVYCALRATSTGVFNIAGVESVSNLELAQCCKTVCGSSGNIVLNGQDDPEEPFKWRIAIDKAASRLGFVPRYSIAQTLANLLAQCPDRTPA